MKKSVDNLSRLCYNVTIKREEIDPMTTKIYTAVSVSCTCPFCGKDTELIVPARGYRRWQEGELIQNALSTLSAGERETLISGLCESCQDSIFGGDDDE